MEATADRVRLDVWLWRARFFKTRGAASDFIAGRGVRITRPGREPAKTDKPSALVGAGDCVAFAAAGRAVAVKVLALGVRRGPPAEAQALYESLEGGEPYI
jgi:ribosome-associated heat shock protein Hsp15